MNNPESIETSIQKQSGIVPESIGKPIEVQPGIIRTRHDRLLEVRFDSPYIPINTFPDFARTFVVPADQSIRVPMPGDAALYMITANNNGQLLASMDSLPNEPIVIDSGTTYLDDSERYSGVMLNPCNILFDAQGISSLGLRAVGVDVIVSVVVWKNLE